MDKERRRIEISKPTIETIVEDASRFAGDPCTTEVSSINLETIRLNPNTLQQIYSFPDNKLVVIGDPTKSQASESWGKLYAFVGNVSVKSDAEKIKALSEILKTFGYAKEQQRNRPGGIPITNALIWPGNLIEIRRGGDLEVVDVVEDAEGLSVWVPWWWFNIQTTTKRLKI